MREKKVTICILLTLATIILGAGILMYRGSLSSIQTPKKQASRKVNPSHKYCQIPNIREMHIERNLKDSNLKKMSFQRLDPILKGVSARLLSLRAKWVFTHPNVGEANPRYLEHIISSLCSIPEPKILQKNKYEDGVYSIKIKMKEVIHLGNKKREHTERYLSFSFGKSLSNRKMMIKIKEEGTSPIFLIIPNKIKGLLKSPMKSFQNHKLVNMFLGSINFARVNINKKEKFFVERNGNIWSVGIKNKYLGKSISKAEEFINRLATMRATNIVKTNINQEECSNMSTYIKIQLEGIRKKKEVLHFGKVNEGKNKILACSTGRTSLFHVHKNILDYILTTPKELQK